MLLRQEARIRGLAKAPEQRRRAFDVGEEKGQGSRGTKPKLKRPRDELLPGLWATAERMIAAGDRDGEVPGDGGALAGSGPHLKPTAERGEPVGHVPLARSHRGVAGVVAGPVVGHGEAQGSALGLNGDAGL